MRSYSQTQIAGIGTACNVGGYFALFAGPYYDRTKSWNRCALDPGTCQSWNAALNLIEVIVRIGYTPRASIPLSVDSWWLFSRVRKLSRVH